MPLICEFLGIKVCMYFNEHNPPHIHVFTSGERAEVDINTGEIMFGVIANNKSRLVKEFTLLYQKQLMDMWEKKEIRKINYEI